MKTQLLLIVALLMVAASTSSCQDGAAKASPKKGPRKVKATNVRIDTVRPSDLDEVVVMRGTARADRNVTVAAEAAGPVDALTVDAGDRIEQGAELARIDYAMRKAQRDQASAAHKLAKKTRDRVAKLRARDLVSQQKLDEVEAQTRTARAALKVARIRLDQSTVRSPLTGIVARRHVEPGEFVGPGQPIVQVVDLSTMVVAARVSESEAPSIRRGMPAKVRIDSLNRDYPATVHVLIPAADPGSRTFEVQVKVANPDHSILVGMAATVRVTVRARQGVVVVPQDVVVETGRDRAVFVENDGVAGRRSVRLGPIEEDRVMVVDGLEPGDRLIVEGHRELRDGSPVRVVEEPASAIATRCDDNSGCDRS